MLERLLARTDVLLDPYRPGVLEALGLDPARLVREHPRLIVARLTGFGQHGPLAHAAGHDLTYLALSGVLAFLGRSAQPPLAPGNLLADFAGGSLMCVIGVLAALWERSRSGKGQIIDAAMIDGVRYLATFVHAAQRTPLWNQPRGENVLDGGAPFYDTYRTKDGRFVAIAPLEPHFYAVFLEKLAPFVPAGSLDAFAGVHQHDRSRWPALRKLLETTFSTRSRSEWETTFAGSDACVSPVLDFGEVSEHDHGRARYPADADAPLPAPRFTRTPPLDPRERREPRDGEHTRDVLLACGWSASEVEAMQARGVVGSASQLSRKGGILPAKL